MTYPSNYPGLKTSVKTVTSIQIRAEMPDGTGWNKRYLLPSAAAGDWARAKTGEWDMKHLPHHSKRTDEDYEMSRKIEEKFYRRSLPIFKAMVAGNKK